MTRHLAALGLFFSVAHAAGAADSLTLNQALLGNVFLSTETVQIPAQTTGDQVFWSVTDFYGATTIGGPAAVDGQGNATILPGLGRLGYFALHVTAMRSGAAVAAADTTFAVVAPANIAAMGDSPFGVACHFAQGWNTDVMALIARGGMARFRDEQYWQYIEPTLTTPPSYTFPSLYTGYMGAAAAYGVRPLAELDFANSSYDGGNTPYTAAGNTAYANYGIALLNRYAPQIGEVEVWNEYNGSYCSGPALADRPGYYTAMLKTAYSAVQTYNAAHPQQTAVKVVGGACVPITLPWFQSLFAAPNGALDYMDAVDVHPYRAIPEGVEIELASLQSMMAQYNHGNGPKPIWATECGSADLINPGRQVMASYLVRMMTLMRTAGVERAYWYLLFDFGGYYTGLLRAPTDPLGKYAPTAAYAAYSNLIQQLYGATYVRRENTDTRTRLYFFNRGGTEVRVAWSPNSTAHLLLAANGPLTLVNIMGETTVVQPSNGTVALNVDVNPVYVIGAVTAVTEIGRDTPLADSVNDFASAQGTTPAPGYYGSWYYGSYAGSIATYDPTGFTQMSWDPSTYQWTAPYYAARIDTDGSHPSSHPDGAGGYAQLWVVRRWQSKVAGSAHIVGSAIRSVIDGDGTGAKIFVDGVQVYSTIVGGGAPSKVFFDVTTPIQIGSKIDFVATPGAGLDINNDYVDYRAVISIPTPTTFSAWQSTYFTASEMTNSAISGDSATPAGDGVRNLFKYAANLNPKVVNATPMFVVGTKGADPARYLTLSVRQAIAATDLTFQTEGCGGDLTAGWQPGGTAIGSPVYNGDGSNTVTYQDVTPMSSTAPRRSLRLRVTRTQ